ncbi:hypothetical protein NUH88_16830 [Nisaea acidiphila]|uniref:Uncharacterized protein n=1 Tax=Nisaea acidiphila TaxID=1862145 RepID=A0A9J7AR48_9PROT|nr:hypothetical protein [Nisaea acidiphila]UUX49057.1 hypothetical protein NUH88_16830 [Nisaea acidiphila]
MSKWTSETLRVVVPDGAELGPAQFHDGKMILQVNDKGETVRLIVIDLATGEPLGNVAMIPESKA